MYRTYNELIKFAKERNWNRDSYEYLELHHILPKNMGGDDSPDNLVFLKVGEHVEAHYLFALEHEWNKKIYYANLNSAWLIIHGKTMGSEIRSIYISDWLSNKDNEKLLETIKLNLKGQPRKERVIKKQPHYWMALNTRYPSFVTEKSIFKYLQMGYVQLKDCPICHNANSDESFACCKEHEDIYLSQKKEEYKNLKAEQTKTSWNRPEDRELRIKNNNGKHGPKEKHIWITNGSEDKLILATEIIPDGYVAGRSKNIPVNPHTEDFRKSVSERRKNSCYVWKGDVSCKEIKKDELEKYLSDGWNKGKKPGTSTSRKGIKQPKMAWVSKDGKALKVREENVGDYISQGFHRGIK